MFGQTVDPRGEEDCPFDLELYPLQIGPKYIPCKEVGSTFIFIWVQMRAAKVPETQTETSRLPWSTPESLSPGLRFQISPLPGVMQHSLPDERWV
jgi:hypothetical protein